MDDMAILMIRTFCIVMLLLCITTVNSLSIKNDVTPGALEIFGNPSYRAISYGGYRESSRDIPPTIPEITEDLRILEAMGIKLLRTYNTSQYPFAERLLTAIHALKQQDSNFEMYVMLGTWIEAHNSWAGGDATDHSRGNVTNNSNEINKAIYLAFTYPGIVKAISVGNEAMVRWAVHYYVYPKTILKWVKYLQKQKQSGIISPDIWITSSDNYESWGGGNDTYHSEDLTQLIEAVDFISIHTYPFHDSFYNQDYWGVLPAEEKIPKQKMIQGVMRRAAEHSESQYKSVVTYLKSLQISKPIHIGESGWASSDNVTYGSGGSKAADEYKQHLYFKYMREWSDKKKITLFYFEAFDEQWKEDSNKLGSEAHFGLIRLNNEVKYALWERFDHGLFRGLLRGGKPLVKSQGGNEVSLINSALLPPFKRTMPVKKISSVNTNNNPGDAIRFNRYIVSHPGVDPSIAKDATYPSAVINLIAWEGTASIAMSFEEVITIETRGGDWWGASLEIQGSEGENLSEFSDGYLNLDVKGDADFAFNVGYQTGRFLEGNQKSYFVPFGPEERYGINNNWTSFKIPMSELSDNTPPIDVTGILSLLSQGFGKNKNIQLRNIFYSQR
ncbi:MAG: exo-beta-1,3-glucanase [Cellvibrionales bacterium TMED49]|nr:MAG: exo-beta-1,3-glucanase [Cellvibrionales bacterium TMED49]